MYFKRARVICNLYNCKILDIKIWTIIRSPNGKYLTCKANMSAIICVTFRARRKSISFSTKYFIEARSRQRTCFIFGKRTRFMYFFFHISFVTLVYINFFFLPVTSSFSFRRKTNDLSGKIKQII